jgi:hypothetical protein
MTGIGFFALLGGCCLGVWGWQEKKVGAKATADPVSVDLAKLESGEKVDNNHLKIGPHYALYYSIVYSSKTRSRFIKTKPNANQTVEYAFYPIVSTSNPDMQALDKLKKQFGGLENVPDNVDIPTPEHFVILVKTKRFKTVGGLPTDDIRSEDSIQGLVINDISSLDSKEEKLIKEDFPNLDVKKILILEDNRKPSSSGTAVGTMIGGGACLFVGLASLGAAVVLVMKSSQSPERERAKKKSRRVRTDDEDDD